MPPQIPCSAKLQICCSKPSRTTSAEAWKLTRAQCIDGRPSTNNLGAPGTHEGRQVGGAKRSSQQRNRRCGQQDVPDVVGTDDENTCFSRERSRGWTCEEATEPPQKA